MRGAERIFALLDEKAEEDEGDVGLVNARVNEKGELEECSERTEIWAWKKPTGELIRVRGDVRFEDVTFSYDGKVDVLKNIGFRGRQGPR
ncbi:MAG: hypothetical protein V8Q85_02110 [Christensenellales bacterium]